MSKVLICGAGKIGRGFIGHLMQRSNIEIYFLDAVQSLVNELNKSRAYKVYIAGEEQSELIRFEQAFSPSDQTELTALIESLDLIVSCVGARHIQSTVKTLLPLLQGRASRKPINWFICENADKPAQLIHQTLCEQQSEAWKNRVNQEIGIIETQVLRSGMSVEPELAALEPLSVKMQNWWTLPADADAVKGDLPQIFGLELKPNFENELQRKLYTFNGLNGPIAYIGACYGHHYMHESANDPQLQTFFDAIQAESAFALVNEFLFNPEEHAAFQKVARLKYADPTLGDLIVRNGQDSARKLGARERLLGPALLCLKHGREPLAYARAIAAALLFEHDDAGTNSVQSCLKEQGPEACLQLFAGLPDGHPLLQLVREAYEQLTLRI